MIVSKLHDLDRRWIFLVLIAGIATSLLFPRRLYIAPEPSVQKAYDAINRLQRNDRVLFGFEYGPSTMPEIHPATLAMMRQCFERGAKIYMFTTWQEGPPMIRDAIRKICRPLRKIENVDYVNLGFRYAGQTDSAVIEGMGSDLKEVFPTTNSGVPYDEVPALEGVKNFSDFKYLVMLSAGTPGIIEYVQYANARYKIPIIGVVTKITAPASYPFLESGQLVGLCAGLIGGAEYEELVRHPGFGMAGLFALSVAHVVVLAFIVVGNLIYLSARLGKQKG